jgi:hypothetical protein
VTPKLLSTPPPDIRELDRTFNRKTEAVSTAKGIGVPWKGNVLTQEEENAVK